MRHKIFLSVSAFIVLHGVFLTMTYGGGVDFAVLKFFTVLSNLLLGVAFIVRVVRSNEYLSFAALIAISVTCLVYNFVLVPFGGASPVFSGYANLVTHLLSVILAVANYLFFEEKGKYRLRHMFVGMVFPAVYWLVFVGGFFEFSPYFFMDPAQIGWGMTMVWFAVLLVVFGLMSLGLVLVDGSERACKVFKVVFLVGMAIFIIKVIRAFVFVVLFVGMLILWSQPRAIEPHERISMLENGADIPAEGLAAETGINLYVNLRGNALRFARHEGDYIFITFRLGNRNVYYHPSFEFMEDENGTWLRIADEIRTRRDAGFKNSSAPWGGDITVFVPSHRDDIFYILEIAGEIGGAVRDTLYYTIAEKVIIDGVSTTSITQRLHESMPEFTFRHVSAGERMSIRIIDENGVLIQELPPVNMRPQFINEFVQFADYNFDGYLDMMLKYDGNTGDGFAWASHIFWLWNPETSRFAPNTRLREITRGTQHHIDYENQQIITTWQNPAGDRSSTDVFEFRDGRFVSAILGLNSSP